MLTAATFFCAASAKSLAEIIAKPDLAKISLPKSTLVPSNLTTNGIDKLTS